MESKTQRSTGEADTGEGIRKVRTGDLRVVLERDAPGGDSSRASGI